MITDPRDDILAAAAHFFSTIGYAQTTTRDIATQAGLRQPSLFHYFRRKEDLLAELLDRTVQPTLDYVEWISSKRARAEVKLYALVATDVSMVCSGPYNLTALYFLPESRAVRFASFWGKRQALFEYYGSLVTTASEGRTFVPLDAELTTKLLFGLVESVATWFDRSKPTMEPDAVGHEAAARILRSLLRRVDDLEAVRDAAEVLRAEPERRRPREAPFASSSYGGS